MAGELKIPKELSDKVLRLIEVARDTGKIKKGTNETTKAVERGEAKMVIIADDVEPKEIVMHLPALCDEKKIPFVFVPSKMELGRAAGIDVASASVSIVDPGEGKDQLKEIVESVEGLKK